MLPPDRPAHHDHRCEGAPRGIMLRQQRGFVLAMAAGSIAGTVIGGLLLGVVPNVILIPLLVVLLIVSAIKVWRHP